MPPYTVILTDFGDPDWDLETQVLQASGLDLNVIRLQAKAPEQLIPQVASADALIVQWASIDSDVIAAMPHCKLIGAAQLAMMKPDACLINMARGPIVDQAALYHALVGKVIAGAALDVLEQEPPDQDEPLLQLPNVIITPHASSWSRESAIQLRRDVAQNVVDVLQDRIPRSVVNRQALGL